MLKSSKFSTKTKKMVKKIFGVTILIVAVAILLFSTIKIFQWITVPTYTSVTEIYIYTPKAGTDVQQSDLNLSRSLLKTYIRILTNDDVTDAVADRLNEARESDPEIYSYLRHHYTKDDIKSMISASPIDDTEIISINVTSTSPDEAYLVNNLLVQAFEHEVIKTMNVHTVECIYKPTFPLSPNHASPDVTIGFLVGNLVVLA